MKVGIVGTGAVGAATAMSIGLRGSAAEVILVNRNRPRARAVATDIRYGAPSSPPMRIVDGDYADLADAGVVVICAGVNEKAGGATDRSDPLGRLRLLAPNAEVFVDVVPRIVKAAPQATILVVTDPPEPLAEITRCLAGHERVLSTSTWLDSLRFRVHLAERLGVARESVDAYVVGEHGTSSVFLWSSARIGAMKLQDILSRRQIEPAAFREAVEHDVRFANISIIEGLGASQYGIGMVAGRIAEAVLRNEHAVFAVGAYNRRFGVTLSLPSIVGRAGVSEVLWPEMSHDEVQALERSADTLRRAVEKYVKR